MQIAILILTLTLVIWKPRGLGIGYSALVGALLAFATGVVTVQDIPTVWALTWNATLNAIALIIIAVILNEAGFFRWLALLLANAALGRGRLFFVSVILLGASVTALLSNIGTALIWTPILLELLLLLGFSSTATLAFVFATGFIADATSLPLPVSNLANLITTDSFHISVLRYVLVMVPVNFLAIATSLGVLWFYCDRDIPLTYSLTRLPLPDSVIRDRLVCQYSFPVLGLLLITYFFAQPLRIPVCIITALGALFVLALAERWFHKQDRVIISINKVVREVPWQVILFSLGMYVIAFGLRNTDLTTLVSLLLQQFSAWGLTQAAMGMAVLATLLSGAMNNLPVVLMNAPAIQDIVEIEPAVREVMVYASVIGCNMGAKITPIGSVSTLLWLDILARKGQPISWRQYISIAFILTLPVLFLSLLGLAIWLPWLVA